MPAPRESAMHTHRFGRKLKLPSTIAIKHGILKMMLQGELRAQALSEKAEEDVIVHSSGVVGRHRRASRLHLSVPKIISAHSDDAIRRGLARRR
jgi:hypothetical protein